MIHPITTQKEPIKKVVLFSKYIFDRFIIEFSNIIDGASFLGSSFTLSLYETDFLTLIGLKSDTGCSSDVCIRVVCIFFY